MEAFDVDLWASPAATGVAPFGLHQTGDAGMNGVWTHAHMPALTLPARRSGDGLPLGLQLCARVGDDERLLAWARSCAARL
jgi:Asp-tRNA(Asn)/Glu-tRNA(Gln) amidotransferase A subunit family amidase